MGKARKTVHVRTSRPHRIKKHTVRSYTRNTSKAFRIKSHTRRPRRTNSQIKSSRTGLPF